ncbi:MAG: L-threonylcarbamoyladenylate synthase [Thermoplasmata archaeon]
MTDETRRALDALRHGKVVLYPTDTLYGLGADATNPDAVDALLRLKGRSASQPISIALSSTEEVEPLARLSEEARAFTRTHLPGPYTLLVHPSPLARRTLAPSIVSAAPTLGIRIPDHPLARELARSLGPITATSANRHGASPARTPAEARRAFGRELAAYLESPPAPTGQPSTLVDLTGPTPKMRPRA